MRVKTPSADIAAVDQTREWIETRVVEPRRQGKSITLQGRELAWSDIEFVWISMSALSSSQLISQLRAEDALRPSMLRATKSLKWRAAGSATDMTDELIDGPVGSAASSSSVAPTPASSADPRKVMVVHGRDAVARRSMFDFLRALRLDPQEWSALVAATGSGAPYIGQVLAKAFEIAQAVVVLSRPMMKAA